MYAHSALATGRDNGIGLSLEHVCCPSEPCPIPSTLCCALRSLAMQWQTLHCRFLKAACSFPTTYTTTGPTASRPARPSTTSPDLTSWSLYVQLCSMWKAGFTLLAGSSAKRLVHVTFHLDRAWGSHLVAFGGSDSILADAHHLVSPPPSSLLSDTASYPAYQIADHPLPKMTFDSHCAL